MPTDHRAELRNIRTFPSLVRYLHDEMDWPIDTDDFEELTFEYAPEELGIDAASAAKIQEIKRLRPLSARQPWGIFFVKFEPKRLPVVALRRILSRVVLKKRASASSAERAAWQMDDLLFVSNYGQQDDRRISLAHFTQDNEMGDLPTLRVLGWDGDDTNLHLDYVAQELQTKLRWPDDETDVAEWRKTWASAFTLRNRETITTSKRLAERLAEVARAIRRKATEALAIESSTGPLRRLMAGFQKALIHDLTEDDFADMYAQTIAYGLLTARVSRPAGLVADNMADLVPVTNPFLKELLETFLRLGGRRRTDQSDTGIDFDELGINEVVQLLRDANMEAVLRDFGDRNPQEDPVIHFYELFLKEYDARKRMQRGVFYTPRPVVSYIVRSVHELLQTEFGLPDGLADTATWGEMASRHKGLTIPEGVKPNDRFVTILDPATGTGTFLVEAIEVIHRTLIEKWKRQGHAEKNILDLWNDYVPRHLLPRLHGYELLMAPYAIAHLKIGLKLHETGYRFESDERARVYLTNALEPAGDSGKQMEFKEWMPALAHEAEAVNEIKRRQRFNVVIGNPPYFGEAGRGGEWISGLMRGVDPDGTGTTESYFRVDEKSLEERTTKWLNDDYVKFIRLSEWLIDMTRIGVLGFVTNHSYIDNPTFRGMRESLLHSFQTIRILDLHGNANKKETSPDRAPDANVFDILQGVAIALMSKTANSDTERTVTHAELWGSREEKYAALTAGRCGARDGRKVAAPAPQFRFVPEDSDLRSEYGSGWSTADIFPVHGVGMTTARDDIVIDFEATPLLERATIFRDSKESDSALCRLLAIPEKKGWSVSRSRRLIRAETNLASHIRPILYRPFDVRLIFYHDSLVWRTVKAVMSHMLSGNNIGMITTRQTKDAWGVMATRHVIGHKTCAAYDVNSLFPLYLLSSERNNLFDTRGSRGEQDEEGRSPNLSREFITAFKKLLGLEFVHGRGHPGRTDSFSADDVFSYAYATFYSPTYRSRYSAFLKSDFPRLPLPASRATFRNLARLGGEVASLHLIEAPVQQALSARYDKAARAWHFEVAEGQRLPVTLSFNGPEWPAVGKVGWSDDTVWLDAAATKKGQPATPGTVGFRGVPEDVWDFHIGGYQVCEKWLKDRKDRVLTAEDITHYHRVVIALHETIRVMGEIDEVIDQHGGWPGAFAQAKIS